MPRPDDNERPIHDSGEIDNLVRQVSDVHRWAFTHGVNRNIDDINKMQRLELILGTRKFSIVLPGGNSTLLIEPSVPISEKELKEIGRAHV